MKDLKHSDGIPTSKYVMMIKAEQCHACQAAKPMFESLESEFPSFEFVRLEFSEDVMPFYKSVIKPEIVRQKKKVNGIMREVVSRQVPVSFPNFLFFDPAQKTEDNPYGFLGNIVGHNEEGLKHILTELSK